MDKRKYLNSKGLSLPLAVWCLMDDYDYDDRENLISVTSLLKPTRQVVLGRRYKESTKEIDAANMISVSMGSALHDSIENAWKKRDKVIEILNDLGILNAEELYENVVFEKRSELEVEVEYTDPTTGEAKKQTMVVSGKFDLAFNGTVQDFKSTTVWSHILGSKDDDYSKQMSMYRLLNPTIITENHGYIGYIFTDWSAQKAREDAKYPRERTLDIKLPLMSIADTEKFVEEKLKEILINECLPDDKLIKCSDEDLWATKDVWKYYKTIGAKRATKVYDNPEDAYAREAREGGIVKEFKGEAKRCKYCNYTNVCGQYNELKMMGRIKE